MAASYYGPMRATDADREKVHTVLQSAYAEGRLTWNEFDSRSSALVVAKTYDQLSVLTRDLYSPVPYQPVHYQSGIRARTNPSAALSLAFGLGQIFAPILAAIVAIVCGHVARAQIRRNGDSGAGMALAGLVLGYIGVLLPALIVLLVAIAARR